MNSFWGFIVIEVWFFVVKLDNLNDVNVIDVIGEVDYDDVLNGY